MAQISVRVSVSDAAQLGLERRIPAIFERAYLASTGVNPVKQAIQNVRASGRRVNLLYVMGFLCVIALLSAANQAELYFGSDKAQFSKFFIAQFIFLAGAIVLLYFQSCTEAELGKLNADIVQSFCADLSVFCNLSGDDPQHLGDLNNNSAREIAKAILVRNAFEQLSFHEQEIGNPDAQLTRMIEEGKMMQEFERRFNVFQRLGLVSGGYKQFFDEARRKMAEAKKSAA